MSTTLISRPAAARRLGPLRTLRLWLERVRLAARIRELRGLAEVPHDVGEAARDRIDRLSRRERALARLIG